jgi:hypothetical protein
VGTVVIVWPVTSEKFVWNTIIRAGKTGHQVFANVATHSLFRALPKEKGAWYCYRYNDNKKHSKLD